MGTQDTLRKTRPPSKTPGPWCGSFIACQDDCVWTYCSDEKRAKAQGIVVDLLAKFDSLDHPPLLNHKSLEKDRGFLVYLSRTYSACVPFFKTSTSLWIDGAIKEIRTVGNLRNDAWRKGICLTWRMTMVRCMLPRMMRSCGKNLDQVKG
mmetsp:Transcript_20351/g.28605  ORF Transcript_20351/g.28605 Transcript_20351/m.28605 type:complete len:150 (+) Transcript_20351:5182-5631(+)